MYEQVLKKKLSILESYTEMVEKNSYRVLASYSYDSEEKPLRSGRVGERPPMTDFSDAESGVYEGSTSNDSLPLNFRDISSIPEHGYFLQMIINAKIMAEFQKQPCDITWRGYKTSIDPTFVMSKENLRKELLTALQTLITLTEIEDKVVLPCFIIIIFILSITFF